MRLIADWNAATNDIRRGSGDDSREWAVLELYGNFPDRNSIPDRSREDAESIVVALLGQPEPWLTGWQRAPGAPGLCAQAVVDYARENAFLHRAGTIGWMPRNGKLLTCGHAAHDRLVHDILKKTIIDVEASGWVRIALTGWQCQFRLSPEQIQALRKLGHMVNLTTDRMKPAWRSGRAD